MKKVKVIKIDVDKCNGCRACEVACSAFHTEPKYGGTNPEKSLIRVLFDERRNIFLPVIAGEYVEAECNGRRLYTIEGKQYDECSFCRASCPSAWFVQQPLGWLLDTLGTNFKTTLHSCCNETGISYVHVNKRPCRDVKCFEERSFTMATSPRRLA